MITYAIYSRKSDERKESTEKSISEQIADNRMLAAQNGLQVGLVVEESKSARVPGVRPLYSDMIRQIERGKIDGIISWKINRLVRNMEEGGKLAQLLIDGKIKEIRTPHQTFKQGDNILPLVLEAATSTQYSLDLRDTVKRGLRGHFERGGWNSKAYVGYVNQRDPMNRKAGIVVPDRDGNRFAILRIGWEMLLTGAYSVENVTKYMNETMGFRTRRTAKSGGKALSRSHASAVFRNPFYAGYVRFKGELRRGVHEPMITEDEFNLVQEILAESARPRYRMHRNVFTYSGVLRCGHCGRQIVGERHTLRSGAPYISYRCSNSNRACTSKGVPEALIEKEVIRLLSRVTIEEQLVENAFGNVERALQRRSDKETEGELRTGTAIADIDSRIERLSNMWLDNLINDQEEYVKKRAQLLKMREAHILRTNEWRTGIETMRANAERCKRYMLYARTTFLVAAPATKREVATALCSSYTLFGLERRIAIVLHPLLEGAVRIAEETSDHPDLDDPQNKGGLESQKNGSYKHIYMHSKEPILFGGQQDSKLEPPEPVEVFLELLAKGSFPDVNLA